MLLSICIPTYNRANCLKKTLSIYIQQTREAGYESMVEFNVSDNGSPDNTESVVKEFIECNKDIVIHYSRNKENQGPDKNYIKAMKMATGDYSILWSDDDYLREEGLVFIINAIKSNPAASVFISNRNLWLNGKKDLGVQYFINPLVETRYFDFSKEDEAISYFASISDIGGLFTYIPAVIYKTEVLRLYDYDGCLDGTFYSFMFYWWQYLLEGRKLLYLNTSYIDCTYGDGSNFGIGINRVLVDFEGLFKVTDALNMPSFIQYKFLSCIRCSYNIITLVNLRLYTDKNVFDNRILPNLKKYGYSDNEIYSLINSSKLRFNVSNAFAILFPKLSKVLWRYYYKLKK